MSVFSVKCALASHLSFQGYPAPVESDGAPDQEGKTKTRAGEYIFINCPEISRFAMEPWSNTNEEAVRNVPFISAVAWTLAL
jgi:hypothetical protein